VDAAPPSPPPSPQPPPQPPPAPQDEADEPAEPKPEPPTPRVPRKLTVTRVAALRSRELTEGGIRAFRRATTADGADRSGLTALTYATMMTYAVDAAVAVALANTLFFAAATAESKTNVALYLVITVAPFAVVAPVIGPMLDKLQRGRRAALAVSFAGRAVLAVVMAFNYENWLLYPAALGAMVLSKSFAVLKAAVTPRVLPQAITLVTTNSRLTTFGLVAGGLGGGVAAGVAALWGSPGALIFTALLAVVGTVLCLRIPRWVESTIGEVAATLRTTARGRRTPMGRHVTVALWGNGAVRVLTGFLTLFVAFVVREQSETDPTRQLILIGIVGAAAGVGSFTGNAAGSRRQFLKSDAVIMSCATAAVLVSVVAAVLPGIATAALVGLIGAAASALAKVCLDAVIQRDLPEESRASAFGRSETVLALAWVFGGAIGVLLPHDTFWLGFAVIAGVIALAGVQSALVARGRSLLPFIGHRAPHRA
jgi:MFS family permease